MMSVDMTHWHLFVEALAIIALLAYDSTGLLISPRFILLIHQLVGPDP